MIAEARVETDRPNRYLVQLCRHLNNKGRHLGLRLRLHAMPEDEHQTPQNARVEWTDTDGLVELDWGRCTLKAQGQHLMLRAESTDEDGLQRIQDLISSHLARFSRRDRLHVTWLRSESSQL